MTRERELERERWRRPKSATFATLGPWRLAGGGSVPPARQHHNVPQAQLTIHAANQKHLAHRSTARIAGGRRARIPCGVISPHLITLHTSGVLTRVLALFSTRTARASARSSATRGRPHLKGYALCVGWLRRGLGAAVGHQLVEVRHEHRAAVAEVRRLVDDLLVHRRERVRHDDERLGAVDLGVEQRG